MKEMKTLTINGVTFTVNDPDSVSYGKEQSLTEDQKVQARENIGAVDAAYVAAANAEVKENLETQIGEVEEGAAATTAAVKQELETQIGAVEEDVEQLKVSPNVLFTEQSLADDQKAQARANIDAVSKANLETQIETVAENASSAMEEAKQELESKIGEVEENASKATAEAKESLETQIREVSEDVAFLDNYVTPQMYGAKADGKTDDTEAIQAAIDASDNVLIPEGTYAICGTVILPGYKTVKLQNKTYLRKIETADNTDPVVRIQGYYNSLIGSGMMCSQIIGDVVTPEGVLLIGDESMDAAPVNGMYNTVRDIGVVGAGVQTEGDPVRVLRICCADGFDKAVYFNTLQNIYIGGGNDGLRLEGNANGNIINNIQFRSVGNNQSLSGAAIHLKRADSTHYPLENIITNVFHHQSKNAATLLIDGGVLYNSIHNIVSEQGGDSAKGIVVSDADEVSKQNDISIIDNCAAGNTLPDWFLLQNTFRRRGHSYAPVMHTLSMQTESMQVQNFAMINGTHKTVEDSFAIQSVTDGNSYKLFTINAEALKARTLTVDIDISFAAPSLNKSTWGSYGKARFVIVGDASYNLTVRKIYALSDLQVWNEPTVDGKNVTFSVYFKKAAGVANNLIYCSYRVFGVKPTSTDWTVTKAEAAETVTDTVNIASCELQTTESGTTENRPSAPFVGQRYFDTTLGKPVWYNGTEWVGSVDDTVISSHDAWSSKNTVERLCTAFTKSGIAVACEPVTGYPLQVVTQLPASEDGYTSLTLYQTGKNLLNNTATAETARGLTFTVADDGSITVNGTATAETYYELGRARLIKGETYILSGCPVGGNAASAYSIYVSHNGTYYYDIGSGISIPATVNVNNTIRILVKSGATLNNLVFRPMVRIASITSDTYEKYSEDSTSFTAAFGKTVYGGNYNWTSGILTDENGETTQLTAQDISVLPGVNTIFSVSGETTVAGRADPVAMIEKLTNAIVALGGNV